MHVITYLPALNSIILGVGLVYYFRQKYKARLKERRVEAFYGADVDSAINSRLSKIRFAMDADKAKIFIFKETDNDGQAHKQMSLSYIQLKPGIHPPNISDLQNLPTSLFPNLISRFLSHRGVIVWNAKDAPDAFIKGRHLAENIDTVMMAGIWGRRENLVGFVSLNYLTNSKFEIDEPTLVTFANEVGQLLDN